MAIAAQHKNLIRSKAPQPGNGSERLAGESSLEIDHWGREVKARRRLSSMRQIARQIRTVLKTFAPGDQQLKISRRAGQAAQPILERPRDQRTQAALATVARRRLDRPDRLSEESKRNFTKKARRFSEESEKDSLKRASQIRRLFLLQMLNNRGKSEGKGTP